jgi:RelA/SpoT family protein
VSSPNSLNNFCTETPIFLVFLRRKALHTDSVLPTNSGGCTFIRGQQGKQLDWIGSWGAAKMTATLQARCRSAEMTYPKLQFSRSAVDKAGALLLAFESGGDVDPSDDDLIAAYEIVTNWRASHSYPLNTFNVTLRRKVAEMCGSPLVAQRLKRYSSIMQKLTTFPRMRLSQMQDIGGLRAIVDTVDQVNAARDVYVSLSLKFKHHLAAQDDYIETPKDSGYRGIHLVFRYDNPQTRLSTTYKGLQIELQFRTRLQHVWATAVETMGMFLQESLKASQGPKGWLDFFALTGSAFAHVEHSPPSAAYSSLSKREVFDAVLENADALCVRDHLAGFTIAADKIASGQYAVTEHGAASAYHLIVLDTEAKQVKIQAFSRDRLNEASEKYGEVEQRVKDGEKLQAVLVSAGSFSNLRAAYPSFFGDTMEFVKQLNLLRLKIRTK